MNEHLEWLKKHVRYEPETGNLYWKLPGRGRQWGKPCGCLDSNGYIKCQFNTIGDYAHIVAWALFYGAWPRGEIDHKNRVRHDNRITNLRDATVSQNQMNRPVESNNQTGIRGVYNTAYGKYKTQIQSVYLGTYETKEEARDAVVQYLGT